MSLTANRNTNVYIDPGAGSIIVQVAGSALIAVAASFSHVKRYLGRLFRRNRR